MSKYQNEVNECFKLQMKINMTMATFAVLSMFFTVSLMFRVSELEDQVETQEQHLINYLEKCGK